MRSICVCLLTALLGCHAGGPRTTNRVTKLVGGSDSAQTIATAKAAAYRIDGMKWGPGPGKRMHKYPVLAGPVAIDDASRSELAAVFLDDATYMWDVAKACEFLPGVLVRYESSPPVDVLLCFSCDELEVCVGDRKVGHEDFDSRRADLVRVAKRAFPDDPAIQKLK